MSPKARRAPIGPVPEWPGPPFCAGDWRELAHSVVERVASQFGDFAIAVGLPCVPARFDRMRALKLPFYRGWALVEALARPLGGRLGTVRFLLGDGEVALLTGRSTVLHWFNPGHLGDLDHPDAAKWYLKFFCASMYTEWGRFRIVESIADVEPGFVRPESLDEVAAAVRPIESRRSDDGRTLMRATVLYRCAVFHSDLAVDGAGGVTMEEDQPVVQNALRLEEVFDGFWQLYPHALAARVPEEVE